MAAETADQIQQGIDQAAEVLETSQETIRKLLTHKDAILALPEQIAQGDIVAVEQFIDTVMTDIDSEMAASIKKDPNFHAVLALIEEHDAALTYLAYSALIFEAIPPNFYAFVSGKGGAYLAIEVILLILMSFLTLGLGTAARATALMARLSARSAKLATTGQKAKQAKLAIRAFTDAIEAITDCTDRLQELGSKLVKARNNGLVIKGKTGTTLTARKTTSKRDQRCRICKSTTHTTPRRLKGCVVVR
jgi:hypothetical protein